MSIFFWKRNKKKGEQKQSTPELVREKNAAVSVRNEAMQKLSSNALTPVERFHLLVKTYRHGKDLIVVPESWASEPFVAQFQGKKLFVDTPWPAIVRTH